MTNSITRVEVSCVNEEWKKTKSSSGLSYTVESAAVLDGTSGFGVDLQVRP